MKGVGSMTTDTKWRKILYWLRKNFPTKLPVRTRRVKHLKNKEDARGLCWLEENDEFFIIHIDKSMTLESQIDVLIHEWAHTLTWFGSDTDDHGDEWALAQGRIYRAFLVWDYGRLVRK